MAGGHGSGGILKVLGYGRLLASLDAWSSARERDGAFLSVPLFEVSDGRGVTDGGVRWRVSDERASSLGCVVTVTALRESSVRRAGRV